MDVAEGFATDCQIRQGRPAFQEGVFDGAGARDCEPELAAQLRAGVAYALEPGEVDCIGLSIQLEML